MVSTASHTMEYAGSGCDYLALPGNGGTPIETNEAISRNNGKVWLTSTDQSGKFKVGDTFTVDQQTGFVNVDPNSYGINVVSDLTPELGGDLDVLNQRLYTSLANTDINLDANGSGLLKVAEYNLGRLPIVTQADIGSSPNQLSLNSALGALAFCDELPRIRPSGSTPLSNLDINFEYVSDTSVKIRMRGADGTVRSSTLTLA